MDAPWPLQTWPWNLPSVSPQHRNQHWHAFLALQQALELPVLTGFHGELIKNEHYNHYEKSPSCLAFMVCVAYPHKDLNYTSVWSLNYCSDLERFSDTSHVQIHVVIGLNHVIFRDFWVDINQLSQTSPTFNVVWKDKTSV